MGDQDKKKLCWNCEGSVLKHLESCPYCGVYLSPSEQDEGAHNLLSPPFPSSFGKTAVPKSPFQKEKTGEEEVAVESEEELSLNSNALLSPLLMFIAGSSFALFGLTLWLFSEKGRLTLSWSEEWSAVFLLLGLPLLVLGFRRVGRLEG